MTSTGASRVQLLYVGNEVLLSKATAELLKGAGYKVRTTNPAHSAHTLKDDKFEGIILCATLSSEEADEVVETAWSSQPDTPIVSVHLGLLGDAPHPKSTIVVDALNGPDALVNAVNAVTHPPKQMSSHAS